MPARDQIFAPGFEPRTKRAIEEFVERRRNVPAGLPIYIVADVPAAANWTGCLIYVSDETGGATVAFSDGSDWRRVQDRAVVA